MEYNTKRGSLARLVYKDSDGNSSSSKFWFNVTNAAILYIYILLGTKLAQNAAPNLEGWSILTLVIAAIITSNKIANMIIKARYGAGAKQDVVDNTDEQPDNKVSSSSATRSSK